jgi:hypothetical protein
MRDDLAAEYIGADSKDYGQEVVDMLLQVMENERDKHVVILAGYKDRMAEAEAAFGEYLTHHMGQPRFADARSVRNELDRARLRHAQRLATEWTATGTGTT